MTHTTLEKLPFFFLAGCSKSASTWLWKCFLEHPEVYTPQPLDRINFFSIHYHEGLDWYQDFFKDHTSEKVLVDPTAEYLKSPFTAERIHDFRSDAKFIFVFRNPIDRAFSLWWHQKRKGHINYDFNDIFNRKGIGAFQPYDDLIASGFYLHWLQPYLRLFPENQIKVMIFDDLEKDPHAYVQEVFRFLEVDHEFVPSIVDSKVNMGIKPKGTESLTLRQRIKKWRAPESPYKLGMDEETRKKLRLIFQPENEKLANYLKKDLSFWT